MNQDNSPPKTALRRSLKILGAAAKIAGKEVGKKVREAATEKYRERAPEFVKTRVEQASILAKNLGELKGAAMKVGQMLSLEGSDWLPPEAIEVLSKLQNDAEKVDLSVMCEVLLRELGEEKVARIEGLGDGAVHAASIGQVYQARIDGRPVAVKVQYPGVADSVSSDVKALRRVLEPFLYASGRRMNLDPFFEEVSLMLSQEANYEQERSFLEEYQQKISEHAPYLAPKPIDEFSSAHVLTMEWIDGIKLGDWMKTSPSQEQREQVAAWLMDLYQLEFFSWGFVQTDPNAGNFLIQPDDLRLVVLDFGSVKKYERSFVQSYSQLIEVFSQGNADNTIQAAIDFGLIDPRESSVAKRCFFRMMEVAIEPFLAERQPFSFSDQDYMRRSRDVVWEFTRELKYSPPPRQILFLHRKLGGIFHLVKLLEVDMDLRPFWESMRQRARAEN